VNDGDLVTIYLTADYGHGENREYSPEIKADLAGEKCMICERLFGEHSQQQFEQCMEQIVKKAKSNL
jgi:hypothetical protein